MTADREIGPDELTSLRRALVEGIANLIIDGHRFPIALDVTDARGTRVSYVLCASGRCTMVDDLDDPDGPLVWPFELTFRSDNMISKVRLSQSPPPN